MSKRLERELRTTLNGRLFLPGDARYDLMRQVFNGAVDGRPAAIAQCLTVEEVQRTVAVASALGRQISVRGGGHNVAGSSVRDGTVCVDLRMMRGVSVDPHALIATAQPGTRLLEFDAATQEFELATTMGIVSDTGLAGLTLGGGLGWLMGVHGLTCDNLIGANLVLADGSRIRAGLGATEDRELLWALRGGGGGLGVVTSFDYQLHVQGPVYAGSLRYRIAHALDALLRYDEISQGFPDQVTGSPALMFGEDGEQYLSIDLCHCGPLNEAEADLREVRSDERIAVDSLGPRSYCGWQQYLDDPFRAGRRSYWKSMSLWSLDEAFAEHVVDRFRSAPSKHIMLTFDHLHGAVQRVPSSATAFGDRSMRYEFLMNVNWESEADDTRLIEWTRSLYSELDAMVDRKGVYLNYLDRDDEDRAVEALSGADLGRLRSLKSEYDPDGQFSATAPVFADPS